MSIGLWITLALVAAILFFSARFMKNLGVVKHGYRERLVTAWGKVRAARRNPAPLPTDGVKPESKLPPKASNDIAPTIIFPRWRKSPRIKRRNKT